MKPKKLSLRELLAIFALVGITTAIQIVNFTVYDTTSASTQRLQQTGAWLSELAVFQRDGSAWTSEFNELDSYTSETVPMHDIRSHRKRLGDMHSLLLDDPYVSTEVREDLRSIALLFPDIDRQTDALETATHEEREEILDVLAPQLRQFTDRTNSLFDREQTSYFQHLTDVTQDNRVAQRNLLIASGMGAALGVFTLALLWTRSRSDLNEAYKALVAEMDERQTAEKALQESENRYRSVLANVNEVVFETTLEGDWVFLTSTWTQLTDYTVAESLGRNFMEFIHPDDHERVTKTFMNYLETVTDTQVHRTEVRYLTKHGTTKWIEVRYHFVLHDGHPHAIWGTLHDITERFELESRLRQAQKLESVGSLAAGIAHEINTPIQFVGDNISFLRNSFTELLAFSKLPPEEVDPDDLEYIESEIPEALDQAAEGVSRVATIVQAMKVFGHPGQSDLQPANLNELVQNTAVVARNEIKYVADIEFELDDLPEVVCDVGELNQVFLNLLVNAAHAIDDVVKVSGGRGRIDVKTVSHGDHVEVLISDTGCGIPPELQERIFDPFFTTKEVGKGSGQGLSITRSMIVDHHGGTIEVQSSPGEGTTFAIKLPVRPKL